MPQLAPMFEQVEQVEQVEQRAAPSPAQNEVRQDKYQPKPDDSQGVAEWRQRMSSDEAKEIYKQRAATAECVNARARNRGLLQMSVRSLPKVRSAVGRSCSRTICCA